MELTVLMPCLNEAETIVTCVTKARSFLRDSGIDGEVLVSDNGSTDGSQLLAEGAGARVVSAPEKGYGSALLAGMSAARGRFVIMGDADDSYDFTALQPFVDALRGGNDLVMGNRFRGGIAAGAMPALHRYLGNPFLSRLGRLFFRSPIGDFHCGLRGFRRDAMLDLGLRCPGMEFASEMVVRATIAKLAITEVPTTLSPDGRSRPPHLQPWADGWRHLRFLLMYSPRWLFLYPGIVIMLLSLGIGIPIIVRPLHIGGITLDVDTLVTAAAAFIVGYQAVLFAIFTKVFATGIGFLAPDERIDRFRRRVTLERGLIVGTIVLVAGVVGAIWAVTYWQGRGYGTLDPTRALRLVVPSVTAIAVGSQTLLASLFLAILDIRRREPSTSDSPPPTADPADLHPLARTTARSAR
jgi:glycosyltransferase involved in cell wall biosynthesis